MKSRCSGISPLVSLSNMTSLKTASSSGSLCCAASRSVATPVSYTHLDKKDRHTKEVEAESVAYTVCQRYGIETSDYSFGYIAGWSSGKETKELKLSLIHIYLHVHEELEDCADEMAARMQEIFDETTDCVIGLMKDVHETFRVRKQEAAEDDADTVTTVSYTHLDRHDPHPPALRFVRLIHGKPSLTEGW